MFFNKIKDFLTKRIVKKRLSNVNHVASTSSVNRIGIVFDETYFYEKESLMKQLVSKGVKENEISILVFKNTIKKKEIIDYPAFSIKDLKWNASFETAVVNDFINQKFDMLINYYDIEKASLLLVSHLSKADFKVGFASVDKRLNHFMIDINAEKYKIFTEELFKYLKILNKL